MGINEEKYKEERKRLLAYIREYAAKNNITHKDIAEKTGFTQNNISRMLMGRYSPTLDNFIRIAEVIGHDVVISKKVLNVDIEDDLLEPKFMFTVDPINNQIYILHRQYPSCLIHIVQELPVRFVVIDLYDKMDNVADIINMPFIDEVKDYWRDYSQSLLDKN